MSTVRPGAETTEAQPKRSTRSCKRKQSKYCCIAHFWPYQSNYQLYNNQNIAIFDQKIGDTFCTTYPLPLSAKDGDRLDEEKARLDNVDKTEKGENNTAATSAPATTQPPEKTPEKKAEPVKDKPATPVKEEDKKSNKSNGAHTPV